MRPAGHVTTWAEFSEAFREHHIPEGLMDRKREEFCNFTQGRLSVDVYSREFGNLARYATEEVSTNAKKQARFRKGLSPELRRDLRLHECTSFQKLVNKAISSETGQTDYDATRKHGRDMGSSSGAGPQKRRVGAQHRPATQVHTEAILPGASPRSAVCTGQNRKSVV